jgi:hypothetical protein
MWEPHQWIDLCDGEQKIYIFLTYNDVCAYSTLLQAQGWKLISIQTEPPHRHHLDDYGAQTWIFRHID